MEVHAIDLVTGEVTPDTRADSQRRELDRVFFYGNTGWAPAFDRERAMSVLLPLLGEPGMSKDIVVGHMIAKGASGKGVARLARVIDAMR